MNIQTLSSPLQKVKVQNIVKYIIRRVTVQLFSGCTIAISLVDAKDELVEDVTLTMKQADYDLWNSDDAYIVDWINTQLHEKYSTHVPEPEVVVMPEPEPSDVQPVPSDVQPEPSDVQPEPEPSDVQPEHVPSDVQPEPEPVPSDVQPEPEPEPVPSDVQPEPEPVPSDVPVAETVPSDVQPDVVIEE
jgi:outer membrane biosynthesis protein TonB